MQKKKQSDLDLIYVLEKTLQTSPSCISTAGATVFNQPPVLRPSQARKWTSENNLHVFETSFDPIICRWWIVAACELTTDMLVGCPSTSHSQKPPELSFILSECLCSACYHRLSVHQCTPFRSIKKCLRRGNKALQASNSSVCKLISSALPLKGQ